MKIIPLSRHGPARGTGSTIALAAVLFVSECASLPVLVAGLLVHEVLHQHRPSPTAQPMLPNLYRITQGAVEYLSELPDLLAGEPAHV